MSYFKFLLTLLLTLTPGFLMAEEIRASSATPTNVHIFPQAGIFVFYAMVTSGEMPVCAGDNRWAIKTDAPGADVLMSMVIAAKVSERTITVQGTGQCNSYGYGYEVNYLYLN